MPKASEQVVRLAAWIRRTQPAQLEQLAGFLRIADQISSLATTDFCQELRQDPAIAKALRERDAQDLEIERLAGQHLSHALWQLGLGTRPAWLDEQEPPTGEGGGLEK